MLHHLSIDKHEQFLPIPKHTDGHKHSTLSYLIISINHIHFRAMMVLFGILSNNFLAIFRLPHFAYISIMEVANLKGS
jgi:hypothetical protein